MTVRTLPGTDQQYHLVSFDKDGKERPGTDGARDSDVLVARLKATDVPITDVFFVAHGWKGDVPAAIEQFDSWMGTMHAMADARERERQRASGFNPLLVGLHWPSQPWGDEREAAPSAGGNLLGGNEDAQVDFFADLIADTGPAREAIAQILAAPEQYAETGELPLEIREAYDTLFRASGLGGDTEVGDLLSDQPPEWDAEAVFQDSLEHAPTGLTLGGGGFADALLSPLRQLSFWKMKKRARKFGESGAAGLLSQLMGVAGPHVRFHLMGHSFGCIVVATAVQAAAKDTTTWRPVSSLLLVQGALSLWAFAKEVLGEKVPGYLEAIVRDGLVDGVIAATHSSHDTAVGKYYPIGARLGSQSTLAATLPKYGGLGTFGMQGVEAKSIRVVPGKVSGAYGLARKQLYNLEASEVIANGKGPSGAHNDISHPEIAHLAWEMIALGR